jgi:hypothetical protein
VDRPDCVDHVRRVNVDEGRIAHAKALLAAFLARDVLRVRPLRGEPPVPPGDHLRRGQLRVAAAHQATALWQAVGAARAGGRRFGPCGKFPNAREHIVVDTLLICSETGTVAEGSHRRSDVRTENTDRGEACFWGRELFQSPVDTARGRGPGAVGCRARRFRDGARAFAAIGSRARRSGTSPRRERRWCSTSPHPRLG